MDRRSFIVLAAAGVVDPSRLGQVQPVQNAAPIPYTAMPAAQPDYSVPGFAEWLSGFRARMLLEGYPADLLDRELTGLTADPRVVRADGRQPEFSRPVSDYVKGAVSDARVREGQGFAASLAFLPAIEAKFGVPREILISIWAMESGFGRIQGDMDVLRCMATLAAEGRRRQFAESQIKAALQLLGTGEVSRPTLRGSWAGAMGQTQFIPTSFLSAAIDQDGDGRRDIWNSQADALGSAANLLAQGGWQRGVSWAREVNLPAGFDYGPWPEGPAQTSLPGGKRRGPGSRTVVDGTPPIRPPRRPCCCRAAPQARRFWLCLTIFAIRKIQTTQTAYALAVGLLADRIAGRNGPVKAWPAETALSLADRSAAQDALRKLGFDPGATDGVIGAGTRGSLRAWQKARGRPADGLSVDRGHKDPDRRSRRNLSRCSRTIKH